ncbi:MAG: proton-conducting transporter membrane subunit [Methanocellales archaeon]|nr:proton-conducting transporter membrane subunit [Methanocellales archaeon]MDD4898161.1 proton-conducting transporter membrane subunit [Methanocellales archaeon]MDD5446753.1 proton-conducting transporter membrane subunit [Methanocellales archaeon]
MIIVSCLPVIALLSPLIAGIISYQAGKISETARDLITIAAAIVSFIVIVAMIPTILNGNTIEYIFSYSAVSTLPMAFRVGPFPLFLGLVISFAWILSAVYSHRYMEHLHSRNRFYLFMSLTLSAVIGTLFAKNMLVLFIFFEITLFTSYVLVIHEETPEAMAAGKKYLFLGLATGLVMFCGILLVYLQVGTLDLGKRGILDGVHGNILYVMLFTLLVGALFKAGMFPLHVWLPSAHPIAPSPASAILSAVVVKEGCYVMIRILYDIFGVNLLKTMFVSNWLILLGGLSIFFGSAMAIRQHDLKTMLAYSTVSKVGYIFLGAALLTPTGLQGAMVHIFHHLMAKSALFFCAGALIYKAGIRDIDQMAGIGKKMPITMMVFTIAALSMIGVPPLVGFASKWYIVVGALEAGRPTAIGFGLVLILSSLMNAIYFIPIIINAFFTGASENGEHKEVIPDDVPLSMAVPMVILAIGIIVFGVLSATTSVVVIKPTVNAMMGL